jgi:hypothetical protein
VQRWGFIGSCEGYSVNHIAAKLSKCDRALLVLDGKQTSESDVSSVEILIIGQGGKKPKALPSHITVVNHHFLIRSMKCMPSCADFLFQAESVPAATTTDHDDIAPSPFVQAAPKSFVQGTDDFMESVEPPSHIRKVVGELDEGAGNLVTYNENGGNQNYRRMARYFARMFRNRWMEADESSGHYAVQKRGSAYKYLEMAQHILKSVDEVTSQHHFNGQRVFGPRGKELIDEVLTNKFDAVHMGDGEDEQRKNREGLLLWAIYWQDIRAVAY